MRLKRCNFQQIPAIRGRIPIMKLFNDLGISSVIKIFTRERMIDALLAHMLCRAVSIT